jgi:hypothetical protein
MYVFIVKFLEKNKSIWSISALLGSDKAWTDVFAIFWMMYCLWIISAFHYINPHIIQKQRSHHTLVWLNWHGSHVPARLWVLSTCLKLRRKWPTILLRDHILNLGITNKTVHCQLKFLQTAPMIQQLGLLHMGPALELGEAQREWGLEICVASFSLPSGPTCLCFWNAMIMGSGPIIAQSLKEYCTIIIIIMKS